MVGRRDVGPVFISEPVVTVEAEKTESTQLLCGNVHFEVEVLITRGSACQIEAY